MKKFFGTFIVTGLGILLHAQENKQLVVTKIRHSVLVNEVYNLNSISFPYYFSDSLFKADFTDTLLKYSSGIYGMDTIVFAEKTFAQSGERIFPIKVKPIVPSDASENNLYMSLSTYISFSTIEYQEVFYKLSAAIHIVNSRNKTVLKTKTEIPFVIRMSEGIVVDTLMHKNDFEIFYLDLLSAALRGTSGSLGKRFIYRPVTQVYDNFLLNASDYTVQQGISDFSLLKTDGEELKIFKYENYETPSDEYSTVFSGHSFIEKYNIFPIAGNESFDVSIDCEIIGTNPQNQSRTVKIELCGNANPFIFSLDEDGNNFGIWRKDTISFIWKESSSVSEILINGELAGLIHYKENEQHLYYRPDLHPNKLIKISILIFLYNEALTVLQTSYPSTGSYYLRKALIEALEQSVY